MFAGLLFLAKLICCLWRWNKEN